MLVPADERVLAGGQGKGPRQEGGRGVEEAADAGEGGGSGGGWW